MWNITKISAVIFMDQNDNILITILWKSHIKVTHGTG